MDANFRLGGIQLVRTQKSAFFDPHPPLVRIFIRKGRTPSLLVHTQGPLNKKCSEVHMYNFEPKAVVLLYRAVVIHRR